MQTDPSKRQSSVEGALQQQHGHTSDILQTHHRNDVVNHLIPNQGGLPQAIRNGSTNEPSLAPGFNFPCFLPGQNILGAEGLPVLLQHQPRPTSPSPTSGSVSVSSSTFLMGMHNYTTLPSDLPEFVMEHQATLTFPEKLMLMLIYVDRENTGEKERKHILRAAAVSWILDGRAFIIRSKDDLVKDLLPMFFRQSKFASFTRKLYRWGFRQVSVSASAERILSSNNKREMIFGHELFQKDNKALMARMRSVTAAGTRRALVSSKQKRQLSAGQYMVIEPKLIPITFPSPFLNLQPSPGSSIILQVAGMHAVPTKESGHAVAPPPMPSTFLLDNSPIPGGQQGEQQTIKSGHSDANDSSMFATISPKLPSPQVALLATPRQQQLKQQTRNAGCVKNIFLASNHQLSRAINVPASGGYFNSLLAQELGVHGSTFQSLQADAPSGTDANAYMRAAIDMLLRHASKSASDSNDDEYRNNKS